MDFPNFRLLPNMTLAIEGISRLAELDYNIDTEWVADALRINDYAYLPGEIDKRLDDNFYLDLRKSVLSLVAEAQNLTDFDPKITEPSMLTAFDKLMYKNIQTLLPLSLYEASKTEIWTYLTLRVLPDVANWRYPNKNKDNSYERHLGSARNVFRRSWVRVFFARDSSGLLVGMGEDQAVAIFERTAVVSNPKIAESALKALTFIRKISTNNEIYRDAMIRVRRLAAIEMIDVLPQAESDALILESFIESLNELAPELVVS